MGVTSIKPDADLGVLLLLGKKVMPTQWTMYSEKKRKIIYIQTHVEKIP